MAEEPENLTLRILQEMRSELNRRLDKVDESIADLSNRVDGISLIMSMVAGLVHNHETRIDKLESR